MILVKLSFGLRKETICMTGTSNMEGDSVWLPSNSWATGRVWKEWMVVYLLVNRSFGVTAFVTPDLLTAEVLQDEVQLSPSLEGVD